MGNDIEPGKYFPSFLSRRAKVVRDCVPSLRVNLRPGCLCLRKSPLLIKNYSTTPCIGLLMDIRANPFGENVSEGRAVVLQLGN